MSAVTIEDLREWIDMMMASMNINDYKIDVGGNTTKGDGYLGEVNFLTVHTKKNGVKQDYELVIKSAKKSEELRKQTPIKVAYDRESLFYSTIFPVLNDFQKEIGVKRLFVNVPKCYSVCNEHHKEALILQNLKKQGFELHDRKTAMNLDHLLLVFQNYGRYHALSLALRHKKPVVFNTITRNLTDVMGQFLKQMDMLDFFYKEFENVKEILKEERETEALTKLQNFEKDFEKILFNCSNEDTSPSVILHGDCWNNNFMFKYNDNDKSRPTDMRFLDFQLLRIASPVMDLSYFFYTCADHQSLDNLDFFLQAYHSSLSDFLRDLGCDAEKIFPFKKLNEHWREYGKYGLVLALLIIKISICNTEDAVDLIETVEKGEDFKESFQVKIQDQGVYNKRMKNLYVHFAKKFL